MRLSALTRSLQGPAFAIFGVASTLLLAAYFTTGGSLVPLAIPLVFVAAVAAARLPAASMVVLLAVTGFQGTLQASTTISVLGIGDLLLAALWVGVIFGYLGGHPARRTWLWPGLIAPAMYLAITLLAVLTSDSTGEAIKSFRLSGWYMSALLLVALAPWSRDTFERIARGVAVVGLAVGAYAVFRYIVGPSAAEEAFARATSAVSGLPGNAELRFFGSFSIAGALAAWTAALTPFCLALGLGLRGRWALLALAGSATCAFAVIASDVRTGYVATAAGVAVVVVIHASAQAFPSGRRLASSAAAVMVAMVLGGGLFALTVGGSEQGVQRYESLVQNPSGDPSYEARLARWEVALNAAAKQPFGYGLGTQGTLGNQRDAGPVATPNLDSSYLKVGIEQGLLVMGFFILALVILAGSLATYAVRASDRFGATLAIGACGTLVASMITFYAGLYVEGLQVLPVWILAGLGAASATTQPASAARASAR